MQKSDIDVKFTEFVFTLLQEKVSDLEINTSNEFCLKFSWGKERMSQPTASGQNLNLNAILMPNFNS